MKLPGRYLLKIACTEVFCPMVKVQVGDVPEQAPLQLTKSLPAGGVAVRVTVAP